MIIDHLEEQRNRSRCRVLYFYFDYREQSEQTPFKVLVTLLKQILSTYSSMPNAASELHKRIERGQSLPSWIELMTIFRSLCSAGEDVFLVLDALDECDEHMHRQQVLEFVEFLFGSAVRIFITSRPYPWDINETFADYPQIAIEASDADIRNFLFAKISMSKRSSRRIIACDPGLQEEIVQSITAKSHGMSVNQSRAKYPSDY